MVNCKKVKFLSLSICKKMKTSIKKKMGQANIAIYFTAEKRKHFRAGWVTSDE